MTAARGILDQRGSGQRLYRNMLVFLAPDLKRLEELERGSAEFLAWKDIDDRSAGAEPRRLPDEPGGVQEARRRPGCRSLVLAETYHWCLVPHQPDPTGPVEWESIKADGQGSLAARASRKLVNSGSLGVAYPAELLRGLLSDGGVLSSMWADGYTTVNALWDAFARYPYLPRLKNLETLCATVRQGANPITWQITGFAVADAFDANTGRYVGLTVHGDARNVIGTTLVVHPDVAAAQLHDEEIQVVSAGSGDRGPEATPTPGVGDDAPSRTTSYVASTRWLGSTRSDTNVTSPNSLPKSSLTSPDSLGPTLRSPLRSRPPTTLGFQTTSRERSLRTLARSSWTRTGSRRSKCRRSPCVTLAMN